MKGSVVVVWPTIVEVVVVEKIEVVELVDDTDVVLVLLVVVVVTTQSMSAVQLSNCAQHARYSPDSGRPLSVHVSWRNRQFALRQNRLQIPRAWKSTPQLCAQLR
jgi:biopolymer transport protein ExbD